MKAGEKRYHLLFWIIKIGIVFYFFQLPFYNANYFWTTSIVAILAHVGYFYGNYLVLYPRYFDKGKYWIYSITAIILTIIHCVILIWSWNQFSAFHLIEWKNNFDGVVGASSIFFSVSFTWKLLEIWVLRINKKLELEKELKNAEYEFLTSQINPHFLFNVLGCISGLALVNSEKTVGAIKNLKNLIGSATQMNIEGKVTLASELAFLRSFINLHEIRYTVPIELSFQNTNIEKYEVEPMLFLPFIENSFKHGDLTETGMVRINCFVNDNLLIFSIENNLVNNSENESGIGLGNSNVEKRLAYVYPNAYKLTVEKTAKTYFVNLQIDLGYE